MSRSKKKLIGLLFPVVAGLAHQVLAIDLVVDGSVNTSTSATYGVISVATTISGSQLQISGTPVIDTGSFYVGEANGKSGAVNHQGGTVNYNGTGTGDSSAFRIGHWPSLTGTYSLEGGILNATNGDVAVGWDGTGYLTATNGTANIKGLRLGRGSGKPTGYLQLSGTSVINIGARGIYTGSSGSYSIILQGGALGAIAGWSSTLNMTLKTTNGVSGSVDTTGGDIILSGILSDLGGLTKIGTGTLTLTATNTYQGPTVISNGVLSLTHSQCLSTNTDVYIYTGGTNNLNFIGTNTIHALYINGVWQERKVCGQSNCPSVFSGSGYLEAIMVAPPSGTVLKIN